MKARQLKIGLRHPIRRAKTIFRLRKMRKNKIEEAIKVMSETIMDAEIERIVKSNNVLEIEKKLREINNLIIAFESPIYKDLLENNFTFSFTYGLLSSKFLQLDALRKKLVRKTARRN